MALNVQFFSDLFVLCLKKAKCLLIMFCCCCPVTFGQIDNDLLDRFKAEAPQAWTDLDKFRLRQFYEEPSWSIQREDYRWKQGDKELVRTVEHKRLNPHEKKLLNITTDYEQGYQTLGAKNEDYEFELFKSINEKIWHLNNLKRRTNSKIDINSILETTSTISHQSAGGFPRWGRVPTKLWFELPNLSFQRVTAIEYEGLPCVEIEMKFSEPNRLFYTGSPEEPYDRKHLKAATATHFCRAVFSPSQYWLIRRLDGYMTGNPSSANEKTKYSIIREYEFVRKGIPHLTLDAEYSGSQTDAEFPSKSSVYSYDRKLSSADVRVSTYGFPEPPGSSQGTYKPRILWITALTIIAIASLVFFMRIFNKYKS